jgi:hypothetical protein
LNVTLETETYSWPCKNLGGKHQLFLMNGHDSFFKIMDKIEKQIYR